VKLSFGDVVSADAEVECPFTGLVGVASTEPLELLFLDRERIPDALQRNGLVAVEGESGVGEATLDGHGGCPIA
jgi:hypothetical protein